MKKAWTVVSCRMLARRLVIFAWSGFGVATYMLGTYDKLRCEPRRSAYYISMKHTLQLILPDILNHDINRLSALDGSLRARIFVSRWINSCMHGSIDSIQGSTASSLRLDVPIKREKAICPRCWWMNRTLRPNEFVNVRRQFEMPDTDSSHTIKSDCPCLSCRNCWQIEAASHICLLRGTPIRCTDRGHDDFCCDFPLV
ncbi:hypothetical protein V8C44DRAFT_19916 [Trichoderma aethiopicum]